MLVFDCVTDVTISGKHSSVDVYFDLPRKRPEDSSQGMHARDKIERKQRKKLILPAVAPSNTTHRSTASR
jgi:hypothetical protein